MIYYNQGRVGYYCSESCAASVVVPVDAQTVPRIDYSTPQANIAVNAKETLYTRRPEGSGEPHMTWEEAHSENMEANAHLVQQLTQLAVEIYDGRITRSTANQALVNETRMMSIELQQIPKAVERLVQAIDLQTAVCDDLRAELAKIAKCMQDERLERHGVKLP